MNIFDSTHFYFNILHFGGIPLFLQKLASTLPWLEQRIVNWLWDARFELGELNMDRVSLHELTANILSVERR